LQTELEAEMREHRATASMLRQATQEAERANAAKGDFLAGMSHELRTPLNAVIGYSQILLEDAEREDNAQDIADLNKIHDAGQHLLTLVNEILELSKIEAGRLELHRETTDMAELIADIARRIEPAAAKDGNRMSCTIGNDLGIAMCDSARFRNMVGQLLDNAAKFTQNGEIRLVAAREASPQGDELVIHVVDTGIGIAADKISGLFEKFTVAEDFSTSKYGGTGLGLALSRRLCNLMGGDILVESDLGKGSRFTIRMPLLPAVSRENPDTAMTVANLPVGSIVPNAVAYTA